MVVEDILSFWNFFMLYGNASCLIQAVCDSVFLNIWNKHNEKSVKVKSTDQP